MKTNHKKCEEIEKLIEDIELRLIELINEYDLLVNKKVFYLKKIKYLFPNF